MNTDPAIAELIFPLSSGEREKLEAWLKALDALGIEDDGENRGAGQSNGRIRE